jgi:hypothetical protein
LITTLEKWQGRIVTKLNKLFGDHACKLGQEEGGPCVEAPYLWVVVPDDWHFENGEKVRGAETITEAYERGMADYRARLEDNLVTERPVVCVSKPTKRGRHSTQYVLMSFDDWAEFLEEWLLMKTEGL